MSPHLLPVSTSRCTRTRIGGLDLFAPNLKSEGGSEDEALAGRASLAGTVPGSVTRVVSACPLQDAACMAHTGGQDRNSVPTDPEDTGPGVHCLARSVRVGPTLVLPTAWQLPAAWRGRSAPVSRGDRCHLIAPLDVEIDI